MRLLIVAATAAEMPRLAPLRGHSVEPLVTGVGMVATAVRCASALARTRYDAVLNVGVCGSFVDRLAAGSVVHVTSESLPELGAEDGAAFISMQELGLIGGEEFPYTGGRLVNAAPPRSATLAALPTAAGITVNTVHGDDRSIARIVERCRPEVESMEGAAFMYACLVQQVPFAQLRAVSNRVERRNRAAWKLGEAIAALHAVTERIVGELCA
jgi:futalosine hydrolase